MRQLSLFPFGTAGASCQCGHPAQAVQAQVHEGAGEAARVPRWWVIYASLHISMPMCEATNLIFVAVSSDYVSIHYRPDVTQFIGKG